MNKNSIWIGVLAATIVVGGTLLYINQPDTRSTSEQNANSAQEQQNSEPTLDGGAMLEKVEDRTIQKDQAESSDLWAGFGSYQNYSPELAKSERESGRSVVLFFHAPWCPYCKTADTNFKANIEKIPQGVSVLKTDYDSNTELRKQYVVTYQHTFVQIDSEGKSVSKWTGGDIENLIKYVK